MTEDERIKSDRRVIAFALTVLAMFLALWGFEVWERGRQNVPRNPEGRGVFSAHETPRSPKWPAVEKHFLEKHPACEVCGHTGKGLVVHHCEPFHEKPELELLESNLITLCGDKGRCNAHYFLAHCGEWRGWNPHIREDAAAMKKRWQESARLVKEKP